MNLVEDCFHLEQVISGGADHTHRCVEAVVVANLGREEIIHSLARRTVHPIVRRVLVRPGGTPARSSYHFKNRVAADGIMWEQWHTCSVHQMTRKFGGIN